jgi:hypothetical protein
MVGPGLGKMQCSGARGHSRFKPNRGSSGVSHGLSHVSGAACEAAHTA